MSNKFLCMNVHSCHLWLYLLLLIGLSCGQYSTTFTNTSAPNPYDWNAIASSSSGQHLVAAAYGGGIYTSSNYGYDWSISADAGSGDWISVASSSSGQYLCAADANWGIIVSSDYGNYWNVTSAQQSTGWISIASDSTGQYLVAVFQYSGVYTSNDYGGTWSLVYYEDVPWNAVACSSNGQYIVAVEFNGQVYTSSNYGDDWVLTNAPDVAWTSVASDSTGQYLTATSSYYGGYIYVSNDYGMNWNLTNAPYAEWYWVSSDSSGQCLFGTSGIGDIFYSLDYGLNWAQADAPDDLYWKYISSSSDCQYVSAVAMGDGIYTTFYAPTSFPSSTPSSEPSAVPTSPSSQPSSQPSCTPSSSPTSQPSVFPSFVPSGQPSVMPTSQPSRSPTGYPTLTSSSFDVSSTVLSTTDKSTFTFTGVGCGSSVFLSAFIDVSYLDSNSNGFMNFTAGSGDNIIVVSERCAPASSCGSVSCAVNVDVSSAVTCEAGGSLQINADTVNAADATGALTLCSYEGNNHLQYAATYTISALPLPTAIPTLAPTAGSNTPIVFQASPNAPFYVVAMCALLLIALGVFLVRLRDKTPGSFAEASLVATCADLALIGYHNSSELFYIIVLFSEGLEALAITIIFTRVLSMLPAVYFLVLSVGPAKYSQHYGKLLNQQHLFKNAPIFSIVVVLMMFEQSMIRYFPWNASGFSKLSRGFPDQHLFKVCMISKTIQLSVTLVIQIVVITVADSDILHGGSSSVAVALLVMYLISSIIMFILSVLTNAIRIGASEGVDEATAGSVNPIVSVDGAGRGAELVQTLGFVESGDAGLKARVEYLEAREREMTRELQELKAMLAISKMS